LSTIAEVFSAQEIKEVDFSTLVSIVREPNMCSGGIETLRVILRESNLRHDAKILEIGSNTGFSSLEIASTLPHSQVIGIDINQRSVDFSVEKAKKHGIQNVEFIQSDALTLPFEDNTFDMVFCSNVTSFINDRDGAVEEYLRVLKPNGILAAAPIYYREIPPYQIKQEVEQAISAKLDVWDSNFWKSLFESKGLKEYFTKDYQYIESNELDIKNYINMVMSQGHLENVEPAVKKEMEDRLKYFYEIFDKNLTYCGFSVMIYKYMAINPEPILHKSREI
jgi:ubiquinone/menaquinone biosynthesis C-methylase UbiE